jgi:hypothetical protein
MQTLREQFTVMVDNMTLDLIDWTPRIVAALALVVLALLVAKLAEKILGALLTQFRVDRGASRLGIESGLRRIGISLPASRFFARIFYWVLLFLFARTFANALGLTPIADAIGTFVAYLPRVVAALIIFLIGTAAARWSGRAITTATEEAGFAYSAALGRVVSGVVLFVLSIMAVNQLNIETAMIRLVTAAILAFCVLALGVSFALGSRDITRNILAGFYARDLFEIGDEIEILGKRGTLTALTPTQFVLSGDGERFAIANSVLLDEVATSR